MSKRKNVSRRDFVKDTSKIAFGAMIVPRHVIGKGYQAPSDTLNIAVVGSGGQGTVNAEAMGVTENIVAVCDVDQANVAREVEGHLRPDRRTGVVNPDAVKLKANYDKAKRHTDWREMLANQKDIDALIVATPDHNHAVIANAAMNLKKHVYVQKPLTWSVHEARTLRETALRTKVVTQMGNQGHSREGTRFINEWYQAGLIGEVRQVYVWTNRPVGYWPQGIPWPTDPTAMIPGRNGGPPTPPPTTPSWNIAGVNRQLATAMWGNYPKPEGLAWDIYLGPCNQDIAYHPVYHPFNWRGWLPFGVGALGDMGAHLIDQPFWALGLEHPTSIEATSTPWGGSQVNPATYPAAMNVHYEFPARGPQPPVKLSWCDGGLMPPRHEWLPDDLVLNRDGGGLLVGSKGLIMYDTYGDNPKLFPASIAAQASSVPKSIPRIDVRHEINFVNACKGKAQPSSPIEYAAQLTETMILGVVALRCGQGRKINYDGAAGQITNYPEGNQFLTREYRQGWAI